MRFAVLTFALAILGTAAVAQDRLFDDLPRLSSFDIERGLRYWVGTGDAENGLGRVSCDGGSLKFELYLEQWYISDWLVAADGQPIIAEISAGTETYRFWVTSLGYDPYDLLAVYGIWIVTLERFGGDREQYERWLDAFATAADVVIGTPTFYIPLSPARGDPENRAALVAACRGR